MPTDEDDTHSLRTPTHLQGMVIADAIFNATQLLIDTINDDKELVTNCPKYAKLAMDQLTQKINI